MSPDTPPLEPPAGDAGDAEAPAAARDEHAIRNRNLAIAGGIAVVLALIVAALLLTGGDDDDAADGPNTTDTRSIEGSGTATDDTTDPESTIDGDGPDSTDPNATDAAGNPINGNDPNGNNPDGANPDEPVTVPPADLTAAYARGFTEVCKEVWSVSDSGYVVDPDDPEVLLPIDDCLFDMDETLGEFEDTVEDAYAAGRAEAEITAENLTLSGLLCNESLEQCWQVP